MILHYRIAIMFLSRSFFLLSTSVRKKPDVRFLLGLINILLKLGSMKFNSELTNKIAPIYRVGSSEVLSAISFISSLIIYANHILYCTISWLMGSLNNTRFLLK